MVPMNQIAMGNKFLCFAEKDCSSAASVRPQKRCLLDTVRPGLQERNT